MSDFVEKATKETAAMLAYQKEKDEKHKKRWSGMRNSGNI